MIKERLGDELEIWLPRIFPFFFWRRLSPHALTVAGTLISLVGAVAFAHGSFVAGGLLLAGGGLFDLVDGVVARRQGTTSRFGAFLDSSLDRLVDMGVLLGLMLHYAAGGRRGMVLVAGLVLISSVMTSYAKARAETLGPEIRVGILERGERVGGLILGGITGLMEPVLWILAVGGFVTVGQRFAAAYRLLERVDLEAAATQGDS